jgi:chemotaxis protein CheC
MLMAALCAELSEVECDALREVGNIGAAHAVTALSEMTGRSFDMSVPSVGLRAYASLSEVIGDPEARAVAVYMQVDGSAGGHAAFLFPYSSAADLTDLLLARPPRSQGAFWEGELDDMACSCLMELGNILASSFLNALSELTELEMPASPPGISVDMAGAIFDSLLTVTPALGVHALTIRTRMIGGLHPIEGLFLYIPEERALPVLFRSLGMA